jgi:hypothetical protein
VLERKSINKKQRRHLLIFVLNWFLQINSNNSGFVVVVAAEGQNLTWNSLLHNSNWRTRFFISKESTQLFETENVSVR